ncbi:hypothetical protein J0H58_08960 [bacterium]|nr:hypothetical protein [bacterium]
MVCVPAANVPPVTGDTGQPTRVRRFGANVCDLPAIAEWLRVGRRSHQGLLLNLNCERRRVEPLAHRATLPSGLASKDSEQVL